MHVEITLDASDQAVLQQASQAWYEDAEAEHEDPYIGKEMLLKVRGWRTAIFLSELHMVYDFTKLVDAGLLEGGDDPTDRRYRITEDGIGVFQALVSAAINEPPPALDDTPAYGWTAAAAQAESQNPAYEHLQAALDTARAQVVALTGENEKLRLALKLAHDHAAFLEESRDQEHDNAYMLYKALVKAAPDAWTAVKPRLFDGNREWDKTLSKSSMWRERAERFEHNLRNAVEAYLTVCGALGLQGSADYVVSQIPLLLNANAAALRELVVWARDTAMIDPDSPHNLPTHITIRQQIHRRLDDQLRQNGDGKVLLERLQNAEYELYLACQTIMGMGEVAKSALRFSAPDAQPVDAQAQGLQLIADRYARDLDQWLAARVSALKMGPVLNP